MPLQNRVTPDGEIIADPARGLFMGNRGGRFHRSDRTLSGRRWVSRQWICCRLAFNGRRREVMSAGYTELFFLDEATALAAGHRPCFECRRADALDFARLFTQVTGETGSDRGDRLTANEIDRRLHLERIAANAMRAGITDLPDGTFVRVERERLLVFQGRLMRWRPAGYQRWTGLCPDASEVITPASIVGVLKAGYRPVIHPSANAHLPE